jgi:ClpP class serine protease
MPSIREESSHAPRRSSRARPYPRAIDVGTLFVILLFALLVLPAIGRWLMATRRARALSAFQRARDAQVIVMIHRQETVGFLGVPLVRYIDIDDSEAVLRAIRLTPDDAPIDLILHTPGGLVLASEQIAYALKAHPAKVTVLVPHYAMSGGTLLALAADEILMDEAAVLGPVDPQLGDMPAASLVRVAAKKPTERLDDRTLVMADVAEKALRHMKQVVRDLVVERLGAEKADSLAEELAGGHYTHDDPITVTEAQALGFAITVGLPAETYELMDLFPQAGGRRPSVQFVPLPMPPADPSRRSRGA